MITFSDKGSGSASLKPNDRAFGNNESNSWARCVAIVSLKKVYVRYVLV